MPRIERFYSVSDSPRDIDPDFTPESLAAQREAFLAAGGVIQDCDHGESGAGKITAGQFTINPRKNLSEESK